jgi:hypothetical protein
MMSTNNAGKNDLRAIAVELNNRGVRHIMKIEYKKAAPCFKKASKLMLDFMKENFPSGQPIVSNPNTASTLDRHEGTDDECDTEVSAAAMANSIINNRKHERDDEHDEEEGKWQEEATNGFRKVPGNCSSASAHVLGQPLWIKQEESASSEEAIPVPYHTLTHQSAIIIYNLGLAFHIGWSDRNCCSSFPGSTTMLLQAIELYAAAKSLVLPTPVNLALGSPVALVALHNMAMALFDLNRKPEASACSNQLATALRFLRVENQNYNIFYLKLLQVGTNTASLFCAVAA